MRSVAVLWDRSLSRADDDLDARDRARSALSGAGAAAGDRADPVRQRRRRAGARRATPTTLVARLRAVRYRGATSLAVLAGQRLTGADACLLFSDGLVTIDRREAFRPDCPLFVLSSAPDADRAYLGVARPQLGRRGLTTSPCASADEVLVRMTRRVPRVADVRASGGARIDYTLLDGGENGWRIVGPMPASGDVVVRLSGLGSGRGRARLCPRGARPPGRAAPAPCGRPTAPLCLPRATSATATPWSASRAATRSPAPTSPSSCWRRAAIMRSRGSSRPPSLPDALREEYRLVREQLKEQETGAHGRRLETVLAGWREMRTWWSTRFDPARAPKREDEDDADEEAARPAVPMPVLISPPPPPPPPLPPPPPPADSAPPPPAREPVPAGGSEDESIVVTGTRIEGRAADSASPVTNMAGESVAADQSAAADGQAARGSDRDRALGVRPALCRRRSRPPRRRSSSAVFAEQQQAHGALPAFWLDVADWAQRKGRRAEAVAARPVRARAADPQQPDAGDRRRPADALRRGGSRHLALERLLAAEDDRPQPRRTLALALAKRAEGAPRDRARADLARAISLLTEVVMTPWDDAYDGIEMISLIEANRLIPRYRALGGGELGARPAADRSARRRSQGGDRMADRGERRRPVG